MLKLKRYKVFWKSLVILVAIIIVVYFLFLNSNDNSTQPVQSRDLISSSSAKVQPASKPDQTEPEQKQPPSHNQQSEQTKPQKDKPHKKHKDYRKSSHKGIVADLKMDDMEIDSPETVERPPQSRQDPNVIGDKPKSPPDPNTRELPNESQKGVIQKKPQQQPGLVDSGGKPKKSRKPKTIEKKQTGRKTKKKKTMKKT